MTHHDESPSPSRGDTLLGDKKDDLYRGLTSTSAALMRPSLWMSQALLWLIILCIATFIYWAGQSELDQAVFAQGRVVTSGNVQRLQNLEGGIIEDILIKAGDRVKPGDILIKIAGKNLTAELNEAQERFYEVQANIIRLTGESEGKTPDFSDPLWQVKRKAVADRAMVLFKSGQDNQKDFLISMDKQILERDEELRLLLSRNEFLFLNRNLLDQELKMSLPLVAQGGLSKVEYLRLQREANQWEAEVKNNETAIATSRSLRLQDLQRRQERLNTHKIEAIAKRNELESQLTALKNILVTSGDRVARTSVRAPVSGVIQRILVNTIGGVIQPGVDLVELVPQDESLVIEASVRPEDIAFLYVGQKAVIRLTAYDFAIYGGLRGVLETLSANTITDEEGNSFYRARIRTVSNVLSHGGDDFAILPGMVAQVDLLTGKRSVLDYLLKPIRRVQQRALRER